MSKGHALEQCYTFMRIFNEKYKDEEILFQVAVASIKDLPFLKHGDKV